MVVQPSYRNSTYFDEIYHGRTAYEFIQKSAVYETTHPPLGKDLLSLGILLFGMNPFGMRFMEALAGIMLILVLFGVGRVVLGTRFGAYAMMLLGVLDFMPFVQSRYATIDTISVLFITSMFLCAFYYLKKQEESPTFVGLPWLGLIFLFFILAMSTKWTGAYGFAGVGVSILIMKVRQYLAFRRRQQEQTLKNRPIQKKKVKSGKKNASVKNPSFSKKSLVPFILGGLALLLLIVPLVYYLSYIPFLQCQGITQPFSSQGLTAVVQSQRDMYGYHSKLVATHPFTSSWWSWPFNFKPLWIYSGTFDAARGSIVSLGNPLIWLIALLSTVILIFNLLVTKKFSLMHLVLLGFVAQYLPWVLVSRITFIYHFYPCLPLFLLFAVFMLESLWQMGKQGRQTIFVMLGACLVLFILFYPALSGLEVPSTYIDKYLRWFPQDWLF
jgi:dolichyl-phosphate-mannose--protein O-mannosyl transferase